MADYRRYSIRLGEKFNAAAPGANTDIFASDLAPHSDVPLIRVGVILAVGSVFKIIVKDSAGGNAKAGKYNGGTALGANQAFIFDFPVPKGAKINFQVETNGAIDMLTVDELVGGGA